MIKNKRFNIMINGVFLTVTIPIIIGLILFLGILDYKEDYGIRDVFFFLASAFGVLTFIMHTINGERNTKIRQQNADDAKEYRSEMLRMEKHKRSYDIISQYYKPEMVESLRAFRELKKNVPKTKDAMYVANLKKHFIVNPKDHSRIHLLLNSFENLALQIKRDYIDEEIVKDALHSMSNNLYSALNSYIKDAQSEEGKENCWDEFIKLNRKWGKPK